MKKTLQNKKGFSLVELIIVIAIMAVLIAILAPNYLRYVEKSRRTKALSNAKNVIDTISVVLTEKQAFNDPDFQTLYSILIAQTSPGAIQQPITIDFSHPANDPRTTDLAEEILNVLGSSNSDSYGIAEFWWNSATDTVSYSVEFNDSDYIVDYNRDVAGADYVYEDGSYKVRYRSDP